MSLHKKKGGESNNETNSPRSTSKPSFRKSKSFDPPSLDGGERTPSQQCGQSVAGISKKKIIPSFFSNLFGNGNKTPVAAVVEEKYEPPCSSSSTTNSPPPSTEKQLNDKKYTSHESVHSVQSIESSSSFSFVNPTKYGGKRKGKRIPVDDPNYGSTTANNNSKTLGGGGGAETKKSFGNTLDRIGIKIGLKKKYNLQSCESLQYIDAEALPNVAGTRSAVVCATSASASGSQGQTVSQIEKEKHNPVSSVASDVVGQRDANKNVNPEINAEFSSKCLGRPKHNITQTKHSEEIDPIVADLPVVPMEPSQNTKVISEAPKQGNEVKTKTFSDGSAQTTLPIRKEAVVVANNATAPPPSAPAISKADVALVATTEAPKKAEKSISMLSSKEKRLSVTETEVNDSKPAAIDPKQKTDFNNASKEPSTESKEKRLSVTDMNDSEAASADPKQIITVSVTDIKSSKTSSKPPEERRPVVDMSELKASSTATDPKEKVPTSSVNNSKVPSEIPKLESKKPVEVKHHSSEPDDQKPCTSRSVLQNDQTLSSQNEVSGEIPKPLLAIGSSNTWSNSNRRKRRAPLPPTAVQEIPKGSSNGTSVVSDTPYDVPSSSSKAAMLTKFTRIEESPPPPSPSTSRFEIRPRKRETSLEPMPVTRPSTSFTPYPNSNTLFTRSHQRFQQHKRSVSDDYSTNTKERVHKPGKKKAPPPPNPFGDPNDDSGESTEISCTSSSTTPGQISTDIEAKNETAASTTVINSTLSSLPPIPTTSKPKESTPSKPIQSVNSIATSQSPKTKQGSIQEQNLSVSTSTSASTPVSSASPASVLSPNLEAEANPRISATSSSETSTTFLTTPANVSTVSTTTSTPTTTVPTDAITIASDPTDEILDEIRQNLINDEHERQLSLLQHQNDIVPAPDPDSSPSLDLQLVAAETSSNELASTSSSAITVTTTTSATANNNSPITENDIQAAQQTLAALSSSVSARNSRSKTNETSTPEADPTVKAKLTQLKKEAEKLSASDQLPPPKTKSRPSSIGSVIYESPLALLFGKSSSASNSNKTSSGSGSNNETPTPSTSITGQASSAESSPKTPAKQPWYKRGGSSGISINPFTSNKPKQTTPIKPFTSLVKFSELDKEAARIVEENKRKSVAAEQQQRCSESDHDQDELDELFSSTIAAGSEAVDRRESANAQQVAGESFHRRHSSVPTRFLTTAQVHPIIAEESNNSVIGEASSFPSEAGDSICSSSNPGNASPPAFQSVHAASKHRQIKPLLSSSPITNLRSEKLAIVQPQTNSSQAPAVSQSISTGSSSIFSSRPTNAITVASGLSTTTSSPTSRSVCSDSEWDCPRCTLKNPNWRILCEICFQRKDTSTQLGSYMSSLLQRVNSENNSNKTANSSSSSPAKVATTTSSLVSSPSTSPASKAITSISSANSTTAPNNSAASQTPASSSASVITTTASTKSNTTTTNSVTACSSSSPTTSQCIPSVVDQFHATSVNTSVSVSDQEKANSNSNKSSPAIKSAKDANKKPDIPLLPSPSSENFLSQLPAKQDLTKEKLLCGTKLHSDPELEELDISKLREVRLAYFERRDSNDDVTTAASASTPSTTSAAPLHVSESKRNSLHQIEQTSNDLDNTINTTAAVSLNKMSSKDKTSFGNSPQRSNDNKINTERDSSRLERKNSAQVNPLSEVTVTTTKKAGKKGRQDENQQQHLQTFSDNEDDFLDNMLQLDNSNSEAYTTTNVANIIANDDADDSLPCPPSTLPTSATSSSPNRVASPTMLQNRYKPKLEAIREGNSQDYTYCYSSTEIAQIYENWQASQQSLSQQQNNSNNFPSNKNLVGSSSSIPSGIISLQHPPPKHFIEQQQQHYPLVLTSNIYPSVHCNNNNSNNVVSNNAPPSRTPSIPIFVPPPPLFVATADRQPYANNRLPDSPEENYMNAAAAAITPTLHNETANFAASSSSPIPPILCLSSFPLVGQQHSTAPASSSLINYNNTATAPVVNQQQNSLSDNNKNSNYENSNNMNLTPGTSSAASGRLSYEDYKKLGAIPKGYPFNSRQHDDWSSESSCDTDSSRGLWGQGFLPGNTPQGMFEFAQQTLEFAGHPDQNAAVAKLMKRLEAAIANGDHRLAATLAHDLALMKVSCVVSKINQPYSIRVYVEDRFMQQGPFLVQVSTMMTVRDLKDKIESDWGIPSGFQKWILGRKMAEDDSLSLSSYEMGPDSMAFLFLVTPDIGNSRVGTLPPVDCKVSNNNQEDKTVVVSDNFSSSTSAFVATSSLNRNIVGGGKDAKVSDISSYGVNIPTGHTYDVIEEDGHLYNNLDNRTAKPTNKPGKSATATAPNKISTAAQTASTSILPSGHKIKEMTPPPPLPPKSPIPHASSPAVKTKVDHHQSSKNKPDSTHTSLTKQNVGSKPQVLKAEISKIQQQNQIKLQNQKQSAGNVSAATILTQSLQQKLAEFKVIAENTFSKTGISVRPRSASKERSPAPPTPPASLSRVNVDANEVKVVTRRTSRGVRSSSRERIVIPNTTNSIERLSREKSESERSGSSPARVVAVENRFNGVLLPTSDSTENPKPPERLDRKVASPEKRFEGDSKPEPQKRVSAIFKKPPIPPQLQEASTSGVENASSHSPVSNNTVAAGEPVNNESFEIIAPAPQPKPRGLKKQQQPSSADKRIKAETEEKLGSSTTAEDSQNAPIAAPRTYASGNTAAVDEAVDFEPKSVAKQILADQKELHVENLHAGPTVENLNDTVDDSCQTTLPFPAVRHKPTHQQSAKEAFIASQTQGSAYSTNSTGLLRPSAFVSQINKPDSSNYTTVGAQAQPQSSSAFTSSSSVLLPILTANFTNANTPATFSSHEAVVTSRANNNPPNTIAVAHVQPLVNTSSKSTKPPTAYVSPSSAASPPSSSSANVLSPQPKNDEVKKEDDHDDSAQQSFLKMLELMEKEDLIRTTEDTECPVCFNFVPNGDGVVLRDCLHIFCRECLVGCVQYADESTVKCPFRDNDYACNYNLQEREIKALVPPEIFEKYLARSVKLAENQSLNSYHCKTPDCSGWCVFEDDVNTFLCPVCKKRNCINCAAIHDGMDCQRYQRELAIAAETDEDAKQSRLMLEKMIQRGEALDCPACHVVLLKKWGCDWVRCSYCKTEICWITKGFRWGPGGKGDESGGCKCGVNGKKCHVKCTYCH